MNELYGPEHVVWVYLRNPTEFMYYARPKGDTPPKLHPLDPTHRLVGPLDRKTGDIGKLDGTSEPVPQIQTVSWPKLIFGLLWTLAKLVLVGCTFAIFIILWCCGGAATGHGARSRHR
jgi:hypothetical protein